MPPRANPLARPKHTANRLSAVYIGSGQPQTPPNNINTPPNGDSESIPDLPEPLSPGASSSGSGLPSPPATNSTGSGSTGDPQSIAVRERPLSFNSSSSGGSGNVGIRDLTFNTMFKGGNSRTLHRSTSSISSTTSERIAEGTDVDDEDDNNDNDSHNNDDDTARLDLRYPRATASNENVLALQRVKSLTQRNRMALDKLSVYPRADTRSPAPSHTSSSASGSSNTSRLSRRPLSSHAPPEPQLSGSETERESTSFHSTSNSNSTSSFHSHSNSSQSHLRTVSQHQPRTQTPPTPHRIRTRLPSAPSSPLKALARTTTTNNNNTISSTSSNGSSPSRARKRVSIAVMDDRERDVYGPGGAVRARSSLALVNREAERDRGDVTQAAMAAVASSRRRNSPTGAPRRRGALPLEFRADLGQGRMSTEPEPMTPYRATHTNNAHNRNNTHTYIIPVSASTSTSSSSFSHTPASSSSSSSFANTSASGSGSNHLTRSATVRERRGQPKWASEDLGGPLSASTASSSSASYITGGRHQEGREYTRDRRESVMGMGEYRERRQSLRAGSAESALAHGTGGRSFFVEGLKAAGLSPSKSKAERVSSSGARHGGGGGGGDVFTREHDDDYDDEGNGRVGRARAGTLIGSRATGGGGLAARATTSMADYRYLGRGDADDDDDDVGVGTRRELRGSKSAFPLREEGAAARNLQKQRERETSLTRERERERDMDRAASSMSRYTTTRAPQERYASPFGSKRYNSGAGPGAVVQAQTQTQEHTRLMRESLAMFEGHIVRLGLTGSGSGGGLGGGGGGNELVRTAQSVAGAAEKLNAMLRYGVSRTLEEQVDAEVEEGEGRAGAREMAEVWRRVGGEYREGQRVSDELIRGLTGLLLGVGKVVRDLASSGGEGQHGRSVSLDEEGLGAAGRRARGSMSPDVGTGGGGSNGGGGSTGGGSGSGRRSVESRRSWDPTTEALRDDASRRLSARAESALGAARPPSSFDTLRDQHRATPQPSVSLPTGPRNSTGNTQSMRRLFTPREQREQQLDAHYADAAMNQADSQEILYTDYEPSPTPASRHQNQTTLDRSRTLPSLSIPKPLPTLPSESLRRSQTTTSKAMPPSSSTVRDRDRRKVSVASISTVRANTTFPASLTTPSSATTALTAHTVSTSHTPDRTAFPSLSRTDSERSARSTVTFSRPSTVSVSALNGLQQQHLEHQRKRTGSGASSGAEPSTSVPPQRLHMMSGSETEQGARRKTLGARTPRASLDSAREAGGSGSRTATVHAADRSAAVALGIGSGGMLPPMNTARRERRRTVTDIWPRD